MSVLFEHDLPASPDEVFAHLTDEALLVQWWPSGAEANPVEGGSYHLWWDGPGWHLRGRYTTVEPPTNLTFTWEWDHEDTPARRVDIAVSPRGDGSHLVIRHEAGSEEEGEGYLEGWNHFIGRLEALLERGN
ncbi:MAG: SRPBCC domain-containing protein [Actinobacteria bacterium]|nr:MAG: SRPBCC domain-containing protein [Actinomycetota bacterium]